MDTLATTSHVLITCNVKYIPQAYRLSVQVLLLATVVGEVLFSAKNILSFVAAATCAVNYVY